MHFLLAGPERVGDIQHPVVALQYRAQLGRGVPQFIEILAVQLELNGAAGAEGLGGKAQLDRIGNTTGQLPPAIGVVARGLAVVVGGHMQLDTNFSQVALGGHIAADTALGNEGADTAEYVGDHARLARRQALVHFRLQFPRGALQLVHRARGGLHRGALRHGQGGVQMVALYRGEELEGHAPADEQGQRQGQHHDAAGDGHVAPAQGRADRGQVVAGGGRLQAPGDARLQAEPAVDQGIVALFGLRLAMGQVGGEDHL